MQHIIIREFRALISQKKTQNVYLQAFPKQALVFMCLQYKSFENTVGKGEIARNEQFLLFPQCFIPIWGTLRHFYQISNCRLQTRSVWKSPKFVVWERVNSCHVEMFLESSTQTIENMSV